MCGLGVNLALTSLCEAHLFRCVCDAVRLHYVLWWFNKKKTFAAHDRFCHILTLLLNSIDFATFISSRLYQPCKLTVDLHRCPRSGCWECPVKFRSPSFQSDGELAVAAGKFESGAALQDLLLSTRCSTNIFYLIGFQKGKLESEIRMFVQMIIRNNDVIL